MQLLLFIKMQNPSPLVKIGIIALSRNIVCNRARSCSKGEGQQEAIDFPFPTDGCPRAEQWTQWDTQTMTIMFSKATRTDHLFNVRTHVWTKHPSGFENISRQENSKREQFISEMGVPYYSKCWRCGIPQFSFTSAQKHEFISYTPCCCLTYRLSLVLWKVQPIFSVKIRQKLKQACPSVERVYSKST